MSKIIAIHGATGTQGGSVVKALLKSEWKVRAITRNPSSASATALLDAGAEVVAATFDDEDSLKKAYEGVEAIFLVTNYWEHLFAGKTALQAGEAEAAQASTAIKIADTLPDLKHFIWSTLPGNREGKAERTVVHHFDFKARIDVKIRKEYPNLAAKTTFLYVGYYANNIANVPTAKPFTYPGSYGVYLWLMPVSREAVIPCAGDANINIGVFAKAILEQPEKSLGRYAAVVVDTPTHGEWLALWAAVTGKRAAYLQVNGTDLAKAFGQAGEEFFASKKVFEENPRWAFDDDDPLLGADLGIEKDLVGTKACFESLKDKLL